MYTRSTRNGIEFGFNNQTVLIWLFFAKQVVGLNRFDLTNCITSKFFYILVDGHENMSDMMCHNHFIGL